MPAIPYIHKTVLSLAPMVLALALAMDVYVPAVPHMAILYRVSASEMQLTLSLFMLTAGIAQLFIGPLSDQYGRRKVMIVSILVFMVGTLLCASAASAPELIAYRITQAIGAIGMMVTGFAIVRDAHHGQASAKAYSYLNGIIAFSPMFAPFIGSYLDVHFGWQATFLSLIPVALWAFISLFLAVPETLSVKDRIPFTWDIFSEYKKIFLNRIFLYYTLSTAIGLSYLFVFCSISPYIIIRILKIPELDYGYYFAFMGISFFVGSLLSSYLVGKIGVYQTVVFGFIITLLGGFIMSGWYFIAGVSIANFIWPMLLIGIGGTFGLGAGSGGAMEPFTKNVGAAAALSGSIRFLFSAIVGMVTITKHVASTLPLGMSAILLSIIGLAIFLYNRDKLQFEYQA